MKFKVGDIVIHSHMLVADIAKDLRNHRTKQYTMKLIGQHFKQINQINCTAKLYTKLYTFSWLGSSINAVHHRGAQLFDNTHTKLTTVDEYELMTDSEFVETIITLCDIHEL